MPIYHRRARQPALRGERPLPQPAPAAARAAGDVHHRQAAQTLDRHPTACDGVRLSSSIAVRWRRMRRTVIVFVHSRARSRSRRRARREGRWRRRRPDGLLSGSARGRADAPEPRQPAAARVPALLERHRQHGRRPVGAAARARAGRQPTTTASRRSATPARLQVRREPKQARPATTSRGDPATIFEFHPTHNHWHTGDVALFEVRRGSRPARSSSATRSRTFCLIDLVQAGRQRADEGAGLLGLRDELPGASRPAGSTSTTRRPTASRST